MKPNERSWHEAPLRAVRTAVLIPALNEEDALPGVLRRVPANTLRIVADNGSTDATPAVAESLGAVVVHEPERGYGAACLAGIRYLAGQAVPPTVLVFLDADGSENPEDIPKLVEPIVAGSADLVLGVRRGAGGDVGTILPHARFGNRLVLALVRILFRQRYQDLPPFRAIRFDSLQDLGMDDRNWGWTLQMQIRAGLRGLRVTEVSVEHRRRSEGVSKISGSLPASFRVGLKMFYTLARERWRAARTRRGTAAQRPVVAGSDAHE